MQKTTIEYEEAGRQSANELFEQVRAVAVNHQDLADRIRDSLPKLAALPGSRPLPQIVSVEIKGFYNTRKGYWPLLSDVFPETYPAINPPSNVEFRGRITVVLTAPPTTGSDILENYFTVLKRTGPVEGYGNDGQQFTFSRSIAFYVDDLPALYTKWMRFVQHGLQQKPPKLSSDELQELRNQFPCNRVLLQDIC